ncbi:hypothetical protein JL722_11448 [Aureococcus anophagefferens]|nr:hypothetical protein JL722_11448 [Aureococcus anophagefferens]
MPNAPYPLDFETQNLEDESKKLQQMLSFYENAKNEQEGAQAVTDALKAAFGSIGFEGVSAAAERTTQVSPEPEPASLDDAARAAAALEEAEAAEDPELRKLADEALKAQYELERETGARGGAPPSEPLTESESFAASGAIASGPPPIPPKEPRRPRRAPRQRRQRRRLARQRRRASPAPAAPARASPAPSSWLARRRDAQRRELGLAGGPAPEAPAAPPRAACDHCGAGAKLRCSGCRSVVYCARACQASAWKAHRETCAGAARDRARSARRRPGPAEADAAAKLAEAEAAAETVAAALEEAEAAEAGVREERAAADAMARAVAAGLDARRGAEAVGDEAGGRVDARGTLPLASTYGKWDAYDGESSDDDAPARDPRGYDKLWCPVHNVSHYGECANDAGGDGVHGN